MNSKICWQLQNGVGTFGLAGLDRFFSFMIVKQLQNFQNRYVRDIIRVPKMKELLKDLATNLAPISSTPANVEIYRYGIKNSEKLSTGWRAAIMKVGQIQLIRRMISQELNFQCQFDSKHLSGALKVLNESLIGDIEDHYQNPLKPYPGEGSPLMSETSSYLECAGISNPLAKIYVTTQKQDYFPVVVFFFALSQLQRLTFNKTVESLLSKKQGENVDGPPFVVGLITLLKQFHSTHTHRFFAYMGQYIRAQIDLNTDPKTKLLPLDALSALMLVDLFCQYSKESRKSANVFIPEYLFDQYKTQMN